MATRIMSYNPKHSLGQGQQAGVALIAVLLFLILITIAGVIAVRQSAVDLRVATSDQANALMMNASDSILADIEQASQPSNTDPQRELYARMLSERDGILGYFGVQTNDKIGDQLHFCYRPSNEYLFSLTNARILKYGGGYDRLGNKGLEGAVCNSEEPNDYVSARNTTMTQVAIRALDSETRAPFDVNTRGELAGVDKSTQVPSISIHSVTVLPALSKADNAVLTECLGLPVGDNVQRDYGVNGTKGNMSTCLRDNGIPSVALVEDGRMEIAVQGGLDRENAVPKNDDCLQDANCKAALEATDSSATSNSGSSPATNP